MAEALSATERLKPTKLSIDILELLCVAEALSATERLKRNGDLCDMLSPISVAEALSATERLKLKWLTDQWNRFIEWQRH